MEHQQPRMHRRRLLTPPSRNPQRPGYVRRLLRFTARHVMRLTQACCSRPRRAKAPTPEPMPFTSEEDLVKKRRVAEWIAKDNSQDSMSRHSLDKITHSRVPSISRPATDSSSSDSWMPPYWRPQPPIKPPRLRKPQPMKRTTDIKPDVVDTASSDTDVSANRDTSIADQDIGASDISTAVPHSTESQRSGSVAATSDRIPGNASSSDLTSTSVHDMVSIDMGGSDASTVIVNSTTCLTTSEMPGTVSQNEPVNSLDIPPMREQDSRVIDMNAPNEETSICTSSISEEHDINITGKCEAAVQASITTVSVGTMTHTAQAVSTQTSTPVLVDTSTHVAFIEPEEIPTPMSTVVFWKHRTATQSSISDELDDAMVDIEDAGTMSDESGDTSSHIELIEPEEISTPMSTVAFWNHQTLHDDMATCIPPSVPSTSKEPTEPTTGSNIIDELDDAMIDIEDPGTMSDEGGGSMICDEVYSYDYTVKCTVDTANEHEEPAAALNIVDQLTDAMDDIENSDVIGDESGGSIYYDPNDFTAKCYVGTDVNGQETLETDHSKEEVDLSVNVEGLSHENLHDGMATNFPHVLPGSSIVQTEPAMESDIVDLLNDAMVDIEMPGIISDESGGNMMRDKVSKPATESNTVNSLNNAMVDIEDPGIINDKDGVILPVTSEIELSLQNLHDDKLVDTSTQAEFIEPEEMVTPMSTVVFWKHQTFHNDVARNDPQSLPNSWKVQTEPASESSIADEVNDAMIDIQDPGVISDECGGNIMGTEGPDSDNKDKVNLPTTVETSVRFENIFVADQSEVTEGKTSGKDSVQSGSSSEADKTVDENCQSSNHTNQPGSSQSAKVQRSSQWTECFEDFDCVQMCTEEHHRKVLSTSCQEFNKDNPDLSMKMMCQKEFVDTKQQAEASCETFSHMKKDGLNDNTGFKDTGKKTFLNARSSLQQLRESLYSDYKDYSRKTSRDRFGQINIEGKSEDETHRNALNDPNKGVHHHHSDISCDEAGPSQPRNEPPDKSTGSNNVKFTECFELPTTSHNGLNDRETYSLKSVLKRRARESSNTDNVVPTNFPNESLDRKESSFELPESVEAATTSSEFPQTSAPEASRWSDMPGTSSDNDNQPTPDTNSQHQEQERPNVKIDREGFAFPNVTVPSISGEEVEFHDEEDTTVQVLLGIGSYGYCDAAKYTRPDGSVVPVAVKRCYDPDDLPTLVREGRFCQYLRDIGVFPEFYGYLLLHQESRLVLGLVSELFADGKTLADVLKHHHLSIAPREWICICVQLAKGLQKIHQCEVIYNDLKSNNILVDVKDPIHPVVKFIDLGLATYKQGVAQNYEQEDVEYVAHIAPEVKGAHASSKYSDIWALGALYWEIHDITQIEGLDYVSQSALITNPLDRPSLEIIIELLESVANNSF